MERTAQADRPEEAPRTLARCQACRPTLRRLRERRGLGRFRVTQTADLCDPGDGSRSENAAPED